MFTDQLADRPARLCLLWLLAAVGVIGIVLALILLLGLGVTHKASEHVLLLRQPFR